MTKPVPRSPLGHKIVGYCAVCGNDVIEFGTDSDGTMQLSHSDGTSFDDRSHPVDFVGRHL